MRERLSSLPTSMVPSSTSSKGSATTPSSGSTTADASAPSVFPVSPSMVPAATAYTALQVFDEMPTRISWQGTHGKAPNYCSGHDNPIQSSLSNLSEQNLDGKTQPYGFHNLDRQSVVLADGTKHSYFTLPADYPLEQPTPPMSPSTGVNVGVTAPLSVAAQSAILAPVLCSKVNITAGSEMMNVHNLQLPMTVQDCRNGLKEMHVSEEKKQDNEQLLKCSGKAPETGPTSACLSYKSDIFDYTLELQKQDDEKAPVNVQLRAPPLNVLIIHEKRNKWDPGDHTILSSTSNKAIFGVPIHVPQQICYYRVPSGQENHSIQFLWDPSILSLLNMLLGKTASPNQVHSGQSCLVTKEVQVQVDRGTPIISPERPTAGIFSFTIEKKSENELHAVCLNNNSGNAFSDTDFPFPHGPVTHAAKSIELTKENSTQEVLARTGSNIAALTWDNSVTRTPLTLLSSTTYTWDPGVLCIIADMMLDQYAVPLQVQFVQLKAEFLFLSLIAGIHFIAPNGIDSVLHATCLIMRRAAHLTQDLTAWPNQVTSASFVWDPGTMLLWWLLFTEEEISWHNDIKFYGIALWMINFQPP